MGRFIFVFRSDAGFSAMEMQAGCVSCSQLRECGYMPAEVRSVCSKQEMLDAGYSAAEIKEANAATGGGGCGCVLS